MLQGWLVQAEAPPGALFSQMKRQICENGVAPADIAFYFVHWLTDLAGAAARPLAGAEKLVTGFPLPVLASFVRSFSVVQRLAVEDEVSAANRPDASHPTPPQFACTSWRHAVMPYTKQSLHSSAGSAVRAIPRVLVAGRSNGGASAADRADRHRSDAASCLSAARGGTAAGRGGI